MSTYDLARMWLAARDATRLFGLPDHPEVIRQGLPREVRAELDALPEEEQDAITSEPVHANGAREEGGRRGRKLKQ